MARLAELPLKRVAQFSIEGDPFPIRWHKLLINALMRQTGLGLYGLMWLSFARGGSEHPGVVAGARIDQEIARLDAADVGSGSLGPWD